MIGSVRLRRRGALLGIALATAATVLASAPVAEAAQGGPDAFGYAFIDNQEAAGPTFSYTDISGTGAVVLGFSDDTSGNVATPFPVTIYGQTVNSLGVTSNGVVSVQANPSTAFTNSCAPSGTFPQETLFVHWDDLLSTVRAETLGVAPNRQFIIQWDSVGQASGYFARAGHINFQLVIDESDPGNWQYRYQTLTNVADSALIGIQAAGGAGATSFLQYSCNQAGAAVAGRAIDWNFVGNNTEVPRVTVAASTPTATEGGDPGVFTFTRTGDRFSTLTVTYSVSGTATSGDDFEPLSGTVNFPFGATSVEVPVTALGDGTADPDETVRVQVEFGPYDRPEPSSATVTIEEPAADPCEGAPPTPFSDVPADNEHAETIACAAHLDIALGYPDGTYHPSEDVSRAQMGSFTARIIGRSGTELPSNPPDAYPGDNGGTHELAINQLDALGVLDDTTGQVGTSYDVSGDMRRDDTAQFLYNAYEVITGVKLADGPDAFTDDEASDNETAINALAAAGVIEGTTATTFDPDGTLSRAQMASLLIRFVRLLVADGVTFT